MRLSLLAIVLLGLSSCSFFSGSKVDAPRELSTIDADIRLQKRWQKSVGAGLGDIYHLVKPAINATTVFANDINGRVYAFDKESGDRKWYKPLKMKVSSGVGIGSGLVLMGSLNGDVVALQQSDGSEKWRVNIASEILAPPQTNGAIVVVQSNDGKLFGLSAVDGKQLWSYTSKLPILTLRGTATPRLIGSNVITGFANGKIAVFSAEDGTLFWERRIAYPQGKTEIERVVDVDGTPAIYGKSVYSTSFNGHLTAMSPAGRTLWIQKVSSHHSPLVFDGIVFVTAADGVISAYDAGTGLPLWQSDLLLNRRLSAPQNIAGFLAVSDYKGYVHIFDPELGILVGRDRFDKDGIRSPMITDGTYLYALGNDGELSAISVHLNGSREGVNY